MASLAEYRKKFSRALTPRSTKPTKDQYEIQWLQNHNLQTQSPLFCLPAELRNEIFALAVTVYEDLSQPYERETYYWRPGFRGPRRMDVAVLRTCKRAWLETHPLPMKALNDAPMAFFLAGDDRRPPEYQNNRRFQTVWGRRFRKFQWSELKTIQFFIQGLTADNIGGFFGQNSARRGSLQPSTVIMTTRYSDWLWWEDRHPLSLDREQMQAIRLPASVTKVVMQFEMIESRVKELNDLLTAVFDDEEEYRWYCQDEEELKIIHVDDPWKHVKEWKWDGPTKFDGEEFEHHPPGDTMTYVVKAVTWER